MSGHLPRNVGDLLVTQMTLFVPLLPGDIDVPHRGCVDVILYQLTKTLDYVFEGGTRDQKMVLVLRVEENSQGG